jgi:hypothetical protein
MPILSLDPLQQSDIFTDLMGFRGSIQELKVEKTKMLLISTRKATFLLKNS